MSSVGGRVYSGSGGGVANAQLPQNRPVRVVNGATAWDPASDHTLATSGTWVQSTWPLPAAPAVGDEYVAKDLNGRVTDAAQLTIDGNGNTVEQILGGFAATLVLGSLSTGEALTFRFMGGGRWGLL